jgi:hypothetical protein
MNYLKSKLIMSLLAILGVTTLLDGAAFGGTRGGGKGVYIGKEIYLSDIIQRKGNENACRWRSGDSVLAENPYLSKILDKISKVDWYFAADFKTQILSLNFCFIGQLRPVQTTDSDDPINFYTEESGPQLAIRMLGDDNNDEVYIDTNIYHSRETTPRSRAFTIVHETMHSYIDLGIARRNMKLRGAVLAIADLYDGKIGLEDFELGLRKAEINFPQGAEIRNAEIPFMTYVGSDTLQRRDILFHASSVSAIIGQRDISALIYALKPEDWGPYKAIQDNWYPSLVGDFCNGSDTQVMDLLSPMLNADSFDLLQYCMVNSHGNLSRPLKDLYYQTHDLVSTYIPFIRRLAQKSVHSESMRVMASRQVVEMSASKLDTRTFRPITELKPVERFDQLQTQMSAFFTQVRDLAAGGAWDQIGKVTWNNPDFYRAFTVIGFANQIEASQDILYREEIPVARDIFTDVSERPLRLLVVVLGPTLGQEFINHIDQSKLGYSIEISDSQKEFAK